MTEPPSEAFDQREVVVLMGESRNGQKQKFLPIIRSGNGKFFGLGEPNTHSRDKMEGHFAQILSPKPPTAKHRALAKAMLKPKASTSPNPAQQSVFRAHQSVLPRTKLLSPVS